VPRKFPHLVHLSPVSDGFVDGCFSQRVNADPPAVQPVGVDARSPAIRPPDQVAAKSPFERDVPVFAIAAFADL
jgi:hypothetical protein